MTKSKFDKSDLLAAAAEHENLSRALLECAAQMDGMVSNYYSAFGIGEAGEVIRNYLEQKAKELRRDGQILTNQAEDIKSIALTIEELQANPDLAKAFR